MIHKLDDNAKIRRAILLFFVTGIGGYILVTSIVTAGEGDQNGWMAVFPSWVAAIIVGLTILSLAQRYPNQTPVEYLPKIVGKALGNILRFLLIITLLVTPVLIIKYYIELMALFIPETPEWAMLFPCILIIAFTAYRGFEAYIRSVAIIFPVSLFVMFIGIVSIIPDIDFNRLLPLLEDGIKPVIKPLIHLTGYAMSSIVLLSMFTPAFMPDDTLKAKKLPKKWLMIVFAFCGLLLTYNAAVQIAFSGAKFTSELTFPILYLSRYIKVGEFLTGFEALLIFYWISIIFYHSLVFFLSGIGGLSCIFKKDMKVASVIIIFVVCISSLLVPDYASLITLDRTFISPAYISLGLLFPILLLIDIIKEKKRKKKAKAK
jgi:spore germination protein KB